MVGEKLSKETEELLGWGGGAGRKRKENGVLEGGKEFHGEEGGQCCQKG